MKHYTIRVVLRNHASEADYENLHARMENRCYYRKILGGNGIWYDLPPAEYHCISTEDIDWVRSQVLQIAHSVDASMRVRVTEGLSAWYDLEKSTYQGGSTVKPPPSVFDYLAKPSPFPAPSYAPTGTLFSALIAPPPPYR